MQSGLDRVAVPTTTTLVDGRSAIALKFPAPTGWQRTIQLDEDVAASTTLIFAGGVEGLAFGSARDGPALDCCGSACVRTCAVCCRPPPGPRR